MAAIQIQGTKRVEEVVLSLATGPGSLSVLITENTFGEPSALYTATVQIHVQRIPFH